MELIVGYAIALFFLLCGSLFFSSADMAYGSLSLGKIEREVEARPDKTGRRALSLAKGYDRTISTILLWNDAINAGLDSVSTLLGIAVAGYCFSITDPDVLENYGLIFSTSTPMTPAHFGDGYAPLLMGKVVDMFYFPLFRWDGVPQWLSFLVDENNYFFGPIFNLADAYISVAVVYLLLFHYRFFQE